ncbi:alpha-ketoglutarate-dependent dioxygenase alkB homolog 7, mitochondrial isoform X2 [Gadus morhua]|uniref:alpha-ketoglutarate-dependent dioxygenase alkB homolog 7, mitochondrial isoform X2 n=1 Tax=Gadus morhua TaxID=8049 RepID=UPI0011B5B2D8|nr:alpha-ketoglutarate-dependent dioxygenase alkB homolog 7, mitochondrial isoform X2 [Gadus morhua]
MKLLKNVLTQINSLNISKYRRCQSSTNSTIRVTGSVFSQLEHYVDGSSRDLIQRLSTQVEVRTQFISKEEECALFQELEPGLKRKRYQFDHWDDAIHGYRETERGTWGSVCEGVLRRVKSVAFPEGSPLLGPVHVLDLDKAGFIKPHIDSIKFCGSTIAGLSLLSDSVMRLVKEDDAHQWLDLFLPRYSLYILRFRTRPGMASPMRS